MSDGVVSSNNKITMTSSDGEIIEIEKEVAMESKDIKNLIEDIADSNRIHVPDVTGKILAMVIEYCKKHVDALNSDENTSEYDFKKWDTKFDQLEQPMLFDLIMAANYLNIKGLLEFTCQTVADIMRGKTPEEIHAMFSIVNYYSLKEEEEVCREHQWASEIIFY